ncbi:hypothetical protein NUU61_009472 [Penicillium alfredii]|uniref:Carrier domain-containing protein n=1 Tax=Penicillium alfredii TaxID=1506179 RepID=A0A9W9EN31_9EURO|nr:uncharacterized protein NUU61_009472 [Penicillium alfredii]KAJ5084893.1 hypothetical protein NUU61_009472 [Penicillium alfredii]
MTTDSPPTQASRVDPATEDRMPQNEHNHSLKDASPDGLSILDSDSCIPIAIVGMGFRGPADATNVEKLWEMILARGEGWGPIPAARWNDTAFYHPDHSRHGTVRSNSAWVSINRLTKQMKINIEGGHFLDEDVSLFDAPFFNMTSDEAAAMDPQQRLLLEVTYEGLESAGIPMAQIMGSKTACFVGSFCADYTDLLLRDPESVPMYQCTNAGQSRAMTANRVSYFFDLKGPSVTVDTACSGSLVALHLACQSLRTGDASIAIAAGVNLVLSHEFMSTMSMMKFLSPDGRCYTFDARANGYARGEAIACLILKPLANAIRDRNTIRAIIRGTGSNQDGRTPGITLPSATAQEALIRDVYSKAGLCPKDTGFVEAHGTGTQAGDPIEIGAIARVFGPGRPPDQPLRIGSIKTNVGHLEGASGLAGVIKAVLMLENCMFLPNRNFETINPRIPLDEWKLKVQLNPEQWKTSQPHRVSINSFGYGGSNAHVIVEDAHGYLTSRGVNGSSRRISSPYHQQLSAKDIATNSNIPRGRLLLVSGFDERSCREQIRKLQEYVSDKRNTINNEESLLDDLVFTLNEHRSKFLWKAAVAGHSITDIAASLSSSVKVRSAVRKPSLGFVFTGQGAQWAGMGKELLQAYPVFRESIERIDRYLARIGASFTVHEEISKLPEDSELSHPLLSQTVCSGLQIALVDLFASWGIYPDSVTGHSSGEVAAAYAAGALCMEDAMAVAYYRGVAASQISTEHQARGAMMAIGMPANDVQHYLNNLSSGKVVVACVNSPSSVTVSGDIAGVDELAQIFKDKSTFTRRLAVDVAYHSHQMELVKNEYLESLRHIKPRRDEDTPGHTVQNRLPSFFSSVYGTEIQAQELGPGYWVSNLLGKVKFADSLRVLCFETSTQRGGIGGATAKRTKRNPARKVNVDCLLEVGPHSALCGPIRQIFQADTKLNTAEIVYASALVRKGNAVTTVLNAAATLASLSYPLDLNAINFTENQNHRPPQLLVDLPPYPWNHTRSYWAEPRLSKMYRNRGYARTDLLGASDNISCPFEPRWRNHIRVSEVPWLAEHRIQSNIVFPAAGYIAMAIEALRQLTQGEGNVSAFVLRDVMIKSALVINELSAVETMVSLRDSKEVSMKGLGQMYQFHIYSVTEDNRWTEHCTGQVGRQSSFSLTDEATSDDADGFVMIPSGTEVHGISAVNVQQLYERLHNIGLEYGPCFANLTEAHASQDGACFAEVTIPNTAAVMPMSFQYPFLIHPCTLDSIFHSVFAALPPNMGLENGPPIPVSIDEMHVSPGLNALAGEVMSICTHVRQGSRGDVLASIAVVDCNDRQCGLDSSILISGLRCKRLEQESGDTNRAKETCIAYRIDWKADPEFLSQENISRCFPQHKYEKVKSAPRKDHEACAAYFIRRALGDSSEPSEQKPGPRSSSAYINYLKSGLQMYDTSHANAHDLSIENVRSSGPLGELICTIGENLDLILQKGKVASLMENPHLWDALWENLSNGLGYQEAVEYLDLISHKKPDLSILEIGVGTGQVAKTFLERLVNGVAVPRCSKYTFVHGDKSILDHTSQSLEQWAELSECKRLDMERNLPEQGLSDHSYDVVVVPDGLYSVRSSRQTLLSIHTILKESGTLMVIDPLLSTHNVQDALLLGALHCLSADELHLSDRGGWNESQWNEMLREAHFTDPDIFSLNEQESSRLFISKPHRVHRQPRRKLLIIREEKDCGIAVDILQGRLVGWSFEVTVTDIAHAQAEGQICLVLSDLQVPLLDHFDEGTLAKVKDIFFRSAGVLWVTRGGAIKPTDPRAGLATGFARTARSESGVSPIITLDLDSQNQLSKKRAAEIIGDLVASRFLSEDASGNDTEYAERDGSVLIPRITESVKDNQQIRAFSEPTTVVEQLFRDRDQPVRVPKTDRQLVIVPDTQMSELPVGYIGIEVHAFGLSEQDAPNSSDDVESESNLGLECSGIVYNMGAGVHGFSVGDRVVCLGVGTARSYYHDRASAFQKIDDDMPFELAAALPVAYSTAYYTVDYLSRIESNDAILVHDAASWCGQAIVEMCRLRDAQIFAIVENPDQRTLLSSRFAIPEKQIFIQDMDDFARGVLRLTGGKKASVVISFDDVKEQDFLKCVASFGQYVQLRRHDTPHQDTPCLSKNISFSTFNLFKLRKERGDLADQIWSKVFRLFREGRLRGPSSTVVYTVDIVQEAIDAIATEKHVVVTAGADDIVKATLPKISPVLFQSDASYLLVGGLGGIGRAIALWMAEHGARSLVFVNRSGLAKEDAKSTVKELEDKGVQVMVHACDISDETQAQRMVIDTSRCAPPDVHIERMTAEDYNTVLGPKYAGTWNLQRHLPHDLDFFVMLSSISGVIGNATQAAYAAGSTFTDSFAAYRNALGLPAVSLDLGTITDVGYLAENKDLAAKMARQGFQGTGTSTLLSLVQVAISQSRTTDTNSQIVTGLGEWKAGESLANFEAPLFSHFRRKYQTDTQMDVRDDFVQKLRDGLEAAKTMDDATSIICDALSAKIASHLAIAVESINPSNSVSEYGVDSHVAVELRNWISKTMGNSVPILEILASGSMLDLAGKIAIQQRRWTEEKE